MLKFAGSEPDGGDSTSAEFVDGFAVRQTGNAGGTLKTDALLIV